MRESTVLDKRREIVSELKELIELCKYGDKNYLTSEKADLNKCKKLIKETRGVHKFRGAETKQKIIL
ncbi:MAG: hypothetical protein DHS20C13_04190 [Thermodesulfobacteriota bacterium]|nr:MAG: hypothetical protein DHS20C13_04190 [Thermodesulfobacteriota bacterium]